MTEPLRLAWLDSPVGRLLLGASATGLALVEFTEPDSPGSADSSGSETARVASAKRRFGSATFEAATGGEFLESAARQLREYFAGERLGFELALDACGSSFETSVWNALRRIPYGETRSYEDIAIEVGRTGGSQAVGQANGRNPLAIVIPCHRVVAKSGAMGGYGGGRERKRFLLGLEQRVAGRVDSTASSTLSNGQIQLFATIPR